MKKKRNLFLSRGLPLTSLLRHQEASKGPLVCLVRTNPLPFAMSVWKHVYVNYHFYPLCYKGKLDEVVQACGFSYILPWSTYIFCPKFFYLSGFLLDVTQSVEVQTLPLWSKPGAMQTAWQRWATFIVLSFFYKRPHRMISHLFNVAGHFGQPIGNIAVSQ